MRIGVTCCHNQPMRRNLRRGQLITQLDIFHRLDRLAYLAWYGLGHKCLREKIFHVNKSVYQSRR